MCVIDAVINRISGDIGYDFDSIEINILRQYIAGYALQAAYDRNVQLEAECVSRIGQAKGDMQEKFYAALEVIEPEAVMKSLDAYLEDNQLLK